MQRLLLFAVLWLCLACGHAMAQAFQDLATTADGSVLYFSSPVRAKGSGQQFYSKIFRWDAATGVQITGIVNDPGPSDGCVSANFYQLHAPQVSQDGSVRAYTASRPSYPNRYCAGAEPNQGVIEQDGQTQRLEGNVALSPNGRYAITTTMTAVFDQFHTVTDLTSGQSTTVFGAFNGSNRRVTDEGTTLSTEPTALVLTDSAGRSRVLLTKCTIDQAVIDRSGTTAVYWTPLQPAGCASGGILSVIDVGTGRETEVLRAFSISDLQLSSDGKTIFYLAGQLYSVGIDGGSPRQITKETDPIAAVAVSGNGQVAFAATAASRLIRIDVASGAATELVPATPVIAAAQRVDSNATIAAIGSLIALSGSGLANAQLSLCGRAVALSPKGWFQVPWDLPEGPCQALVTSDSPFEHAVDLEVQRFDPAFIQGLVFHQALDGVVTQYNPAHPGEVVVAYMTGLGPVDDNGLVDSGFQCQFDATPAEVQYAGLAPQVTGFYQVNVRIPATVSIMPVLFCGWDIERRSSIGLWVAP